jgi:hypothetical protein
MRALLVAVGLTVLGAASAGPVGATQRHDIIYLGRSAYLAVEGGAGTVDVKRCCHSFTDASVRLSTSPGSAVTADYSDVTKTIAFDEPVDEGRGRIQTVDDSAVEGLETVNLALSDPRGGASLAYPKDGVLTIVDDDGESRASFLASSTPTFENRASVELLVIRSGPVDDPASINYATSDSTATAGEDYGEAIGSLSWAAGERAKRITIDLMDDSVEECDESATVELSEPSGMALADPSGAEILIHDDECAASDTSPPFTAFHQPLNGRTYRSDDLQDVLVYADDGDGSGVKQIAIAFVKKLRSGRCKWLDKDARRFVRGRCDDRRWMLFPGRDLLAYPFPERLDPSVGDGAPVRFYKGWSRGTDVVGNVESAFDLNRNVSRFEVR